jgi:two-component system, chemotaxis family, chemotaxis protein CheY
MALDPFMPVLVVDDHGATIQIIRALLRQVGFADVDDANNGAEALTKMRLKRYGLVISEWHLEQMTGNDLLQQVRSDPCFKRITFIVIGESNSKNVIAAKKAGANIYIVKPFDAQTLKAKIEAVFATRTTLLPERQQSVATTQSMLLSEGSDATSTSGSAQKKFSGRFTGSS